MRARFARFNAVGLLGAALQTLLIYVLVRCLGVAEHWATPGAVEMVLLHNFFWHEHVTWGDRRYGGLRPAAMRLLRFHAANGLVSIAGNTLLMYGLVEKLKFPVVPAALAAIALCAPVNFLAADQWVYNGPSARRKARRAGAGESCGKCTIGCRLD